MTLGEISLQKFVKREKCNKSFCLDWQKLILSIRTNETEGSDFKQILRLCSINLSFSDYEGLRNERFSEGNYSAFIGLGVRAGLGLTRLATKVARESWLPLKARKKRYTLVRAARNLDV
jgi:hypothetical protein